MTRPSIRSLLPLSAWRTTRPSIRSRVPIAARRTTHPSIRSLLLIGVACLGLSPGVSRAEDPKATSLTVLPWSGAEVTFTRDDQRFVGAFSDVHGRLRIRAEASTPLNRSDQPALSSSQGLVSGFEAQLQVSYDNTRNSLELDTADFWGLQICAKYLKPGKKVCTPEKIAAWAHDNRFSNDVEASRAAQGFLLTELGLHQSLLEELRQKICQKYPKDLASEGKSCTPADVAKWAKENQHSPTEDVKLDALAYLAAMNAPPPSLVARWGREICQEYLQMPPGDCSGEAALQWAEWNRDSKDEKARQTAREYLKAVEAAAADQRHRIVPRPTRTQRLFYTVGGEGAFSYNALTVYAGDIASEPMAVSKFHRELGLSGTLYFAPSLALTLRTGLEQVQSPKTEKVERCTTVVGESDPNVEARACEQVDYIADVAALEAALTPTTSFYLRLAGTWLIPRSVGNNIPGIEARVSLEGLGGTPTFDWSVTGFFVSRVFESDKARSRFGLGFKLSHALADGSLQGFTPFAVAALSL